MTKLTYTATQGSYYNASEENATVPGWVRPPGFTCDPPAGMRALLFVQEETELGVIAFRGTDLGSGASGDADRCADAMLFGRDPPLYCTRFPPSTLDYWQAALAFIARVRTAFPRVDLLQTGHSLGAGLALATAVATSSATGTDAGETSQAAQLHTAVAFASPGWLAILEQQAHLPAPPAAAAQRSLYAMADVWDPVQREAVAQQAMIGTECLWDSPPTDACELCFASQPFNASAAGCDVCFRERHVYSHYLHVDVPGERAMCHTI